MARVVMDRIVGLHHAAVVAQRVAGVRVHVEPGVVAARDVDPDPVTLLEDVRGGVERDRDRHDLAGLEKGRLVVEALAVAGAEDRVAEVQVEAERVIGLGGISSISLAVKSVSGAVELTQSLTTTVPVTSRSASSGAVRKTSTSRRSESGSRLPAAWVSSRGRWS